MHLSASILFHNHHIKWQRTTWEVPEEVPLT